MPKITKIQPAIPSLPVRKKVAAYARVSVEKGRTLNSLSAQVSHYSAFIQSRPEWEYVGVYADSGESGSGKKGRTEFQRLLADCEAGKIDIVLTKSISRFARNTVDLLEIVRDLKSKGIEVRFERENISSLSGDGELMLSILASFAQEESLSTSENIKWAMRKRYKEGKHPHHYIYGYRYENKVCQIVPEEAEAIQFIFKSYIAGDSVPFIINRLQEMDVKTRQGKDKFYIDRIHKMLKCERYTGVLVCQQTYSEGPLNKKRIKNNGELPMYVIENPELAIIDRSTFDAAQAERQRRKTEGHLSMKWLRRNKFSGKIKCGLCGRPFYRQSSKYRVVWHCASKKDKHVANCDVKDIHEQIFEALVGAEPFEEITVQHGEQLTVRRSSHE